MSDDELLARCLEHDRDAWNELVGRFSKLIFNVIYETHRRHGESIAEERADDLFHAVFLALYDHNYKKLRQWSGRCSLASWVRLIASSIVIDELRKRRPRLGTDDDAVLQLGDRLSDLSDPVDHLLIRVDRVRRVRRALGGLSAADRDLLLRLYHDEQPIGALASELGVKPGALYTRKNRALGRLRALLEADPDNPPSDL